MNRAPTDNETLITSLDDADRFNDLSLFVYQQNKHLYEKYMHTQHADAVATHTSKSSSKKNAHNVPVQSEVCTLL